MNATSLHRLLRLGMALAALGASPARAATVDFAKEIQPVFEANCVKCHGPARSENGLRLDLKTEALKGGDHGPAFVAGTGGTGQRHRPTICHETVPCRGQPHRPFEG